jgi:outer membrane protein assembly factor BamB
MKICLGKIGILSLLTICGILTTRAQESGWRGPGRSGTYNETGLLKIWPAPGPSLVWEATGMGTGYSSATVTDDAVYITGRIGDNDVLTAYSQDGKKKWDVVYGSASKSDHPDTRSTPTFSNGKIFLVSGEGDLVCISRDGKIIWTVNYIKKFNSGPPKFGTAESPLVVGNLVIGTPGGDVTSMAAFNADDGNVVWTAPSVKEGTQYVSPLLIDDKGIKLIVTITKHYILGVDPATGKLEWKFDYEGINTKTGGFRNHTNTPVYRDGSLFAGNGYGQIGVRLKLNADGSEPSVMWKNPDINPHIGGIVLLGNYLYSSTHDSNSKGRWICVDWTTGKTMWITGWNNKGPIISADGMLYIMEEKNGNIGLVKPDSQKLDVVSSFRVTKGEGPYWAHPVIDKGRLFVRHGNYLAVYSIKEK